MPTEPDLLHQRRDDDASRREGRERPGLRPVADHDGHEKRRNRRARADAHRHRRQHRRGGDVARPERRDDRGEHEEHHRHSPVLPRQIRTDACATRSSVPLSCACVNSSVTPTSIRNSLRRKAVQHLGELHAAEIHAEDPRQGQAEHADVQLTEAADDHGEHERAERKPRQIHLTPSRAIAAIRTAGCTADSPVKSAI